MPVRGQAIALRLNDFPGMTADRVYRFAAASEDGADRDEQSDPAWKPRQEELPFKVEVWDESCAYSEQVLAVTSNASIGHAAFYAATRDFPGRYITLRHRGRIISRWNAPER